MANRRFEIKQRGSVSRRTKAVYLIIAEGHNKTETLYLSHFQDQVNDFNIRFVKAGNKTDAESLYQTVVNKWKEFGLSGNSGDKAFVVVDMDNDSQKAEKLRKLIEENSNKDISFIISNPTFEIWFLLHFRYSTKFYPDGEAVIHDLKKYIPDYEKNSDCFSECLSGLQDAVANASKLENYFAEAEWPSVECNPRTDVGELVEVLWDKKAD